MNKYNYTGTDFRFHYDICHGFFMAGGKDICLLPGKDFQKEDYCIVPEDGTYLIQFEADARLEFQLNGIIVDRKALKLDGVIEVLHIPLKRGKNRLLLVISN